MCAKLPAFLPRSLGVLLPMLLRLGGDAEEWAAAEPEDGLREDDEDDDEKEANYAAEALERLCMVLGGDEVTRLLLPELTPLLGSAAPWTSRHAALIAIATTGEHGAAVLEPHLPMLVEMLCASALAPEPRLRWATCYCLALLCDEFPQLPETMHTQLCPLLTTLMADACPRVAAAAALATVNLFGAMEEEELLVHAQAAFTSLHALLSSAATANYVAFAACSSLSVLSQGLADAPGKPMGQAYTTLMPHLAQRLGPAVSARSGRLAAQLLAALGNLAAAAGPDTVAPHAPALIASIAQMLGRKEVAEDRALLRASHAALARLAEVASSAFVGVFESLLPTLLEAAKMDVEWSCERVEEEADEDEEGFDVKYVHNKGKGLVKIRVNSSQMDEKQLALDALYSYANALGATFHPAARPLLEACLPVLTYRWSDKARGAAATALAEGYKCVVLAASTGAGGMTNAHAAEMLGVMLKPISEQLNKETSIDAVDAFLDAIKECLALERTHMVGALVGPTAVSGVIQLLKCQLQHDEQRVKARTAAAAERDEDEEPTEDEEAEMEAEVEMLATAAALIGELVRQHGDMAVTQVEAQLLPLIQPWLLSGSDAVRLSLGLEVLMSVISHAGREHGKKYVTAALPLFLQHSENAGEPRLRRAALAGLGVVGEHGGKLLTKAKAAEVANRLLGVLEGASARLAANIETSEAAAAALGKMLVHRSGAVDAERALPSWLSWLPLRHSDDDARAAIGCLHKLCEADAPTVFGADGGRFPAVLGAMAAAYEAEATGDDVSQLLRSLVRQWAASHGEMMQAAAAALPQAHLREMLCRMVA